MKSQIVSTNGVPTYATVVHNGELLTAVAGAHPNFNAIVEGLKKNPNDEKVVRLFDIGKTVQDRLRKVSERISLAGSTVFFDGDPVDNVLTEQVVRFVEAGVEDWKPLVAFMEKVEINPNKNSREQLYLWLKNDDFTITPDGDFVAYKGVTAARESTRVAPADEKVMVNGEHIADRFVPNPDGAIVEMPRSVVNDNPNITCSVGLHVGTFAYAYSFSQQVLEVHVNPRDVVSVTADYNRSKIRTCRYKVIGVVTERNNKPVIEAPKPAPVKDNLLRIGDKVKVVNVVMARRIGGNYERVPVGTLATVVSLTNGGNYVGVTWDNGAFVNDSWGLDRFEKVSDGAQRVDTRENHKKQKRYPKGHPKAGQFVPANG